MTTKEHRAAVNLIDKTFSRLAGSCESTNNWDKYLAIHQQEERDHRRFCPDGVRPGLTAAQSVRLFAVKEIFERWIPNNGTEQVWTPTAADYFSIKKSVFAACSIARDRAEEIQAEFTLDEMRHWLETIDYYALNKDTRELATA